MSSLINDLNSIYTTKLQIKEVIGTQSDIFSDYPAYIQAAIEGGGGSGQIDWAEVEAYGYVVPTGTVNVGSNGTVDVAGYANAYVNVEGGGLTWDEVASYGYIVPAGSTTITSNGLNIDVSSYAYANVLVSAPGPFGTYSVTDNGIYDITDYEYVDVNVSGGGSGTVALNDITACYTHRAITASISADKVVVNGTTYNVVNQIPYTYCYPASLEVKDLSPVFPECYAAVSESFDLVQREYTYNSLPDAYWNGYDDGEGTSYGMDDIYKSTMSAYSTMDLAEEGICGEIKYKLIDYKHFEFTDWQGHSRRMRIPASSVGDYLTYAYSLWNTTYNTGLVGIASYNTSFDLDTLTGHVWDVVVDGNDYIVDIVAKSGDLYANAFVLDNGDPTDPESTFTASGDNFTYSFTLTESDSIYQGKYLHTRIAYELTEEGGEAWRGVNIEGIYFSGNPAASESMTAAAIIDSDNFYFDASGLDVNNGGAYESFTLNVTVSIPKDFFWAGNRQAAISYTFSGTESDRWNYNLE